MKKLITILLSGFLIVSFSNAHAATVTTKTASTTKATTNTSKPVAVATVNIYNPKTTKINAGEYSISFDLYNRVGIQSNIRYGIELINADKFAIVDTNLSNESLTLKEKETKSKEMSLVIPDSPNVVMELLKQHGEFKDLIKEQNKIILEQNKHVCELISSGKIGNTTNSHNITNKNKFNINLFLNEQCKDAMNIMDFVNSLQLQLTDLEKVGENGFVKGISNILIKNLKELDINKRPIHCSDLKRETMYVKDENTWEKESGKKDKLTKMIQHVAHKNVKQLPEWQKENPDFNHSESVESEKYLKIVGESMGGSTEDDDIENYNKIIKTIAKEVSIE